MNRPFLNASIAVYGLAIRSGLPSLLSKMMAGGDRAGDCTSGVNSSGVFAPVLNKLLPLARDAWGFLTAILIVVASLTALFAVLQGTTGASIGGSGMTSRAILVMGTIIVMVLIGFLLLPQLACLLQQSAPAAPF